MWGLPGESDQEVMLKKFTSDPNSSKELYLRRTWCILIIFTFVSIFFAQLVQDFFSRIAWLRWFSCATSGS
jgi:hypothetical protein